MTRRSSIVTRRRAAAAALALLGALFAAADAGAALCVNATGKNGCYSSIQAALDEAEDGTRVNVAPGTYRETLTINKPGIQLLGTGRTPGQVRIDGSRPANPAILGITVYGENALIRNLEVRGTLAHGIRSFASGTRISRVRVTSVTGNCVFIEGAGARIDASTIRGCFSGIGIRAVGDDIRVSGTSVSLSQGIHLDGDYARILSSSVSHSTGSGIYVFGDFPTVRGCRINTVATNGVVFEGTNAGDSAAAAVLEDTRISAAGATGITGALSGGSILSENTVEGGTGNGIDVTCAADCASVRFSGNTVRGTAPGRTGFNLFAASPGLEVRDNRALGNGGPGFRIYGEGAVLTSNLARDNGVSPTDAGFEVNGLGHQVRRSVASGNSGPGFSAVGNSHALTGNRAEGNLGGGFAIGVSAPSSGIAVVGATALRNLFTGIAVPPACPGCTVDASRAGGNSAWDYCGAAALSGNDFGTVCP